MRELSPLGCGSVSMQTLCAARDDDPRTSKAGRAFALLPKVNGGSSERLGEPFRPADGSGGRRKRSDAEFGYAVRGCWCFGVKMRRAVSTSPMRSASDGQLIGPASSGARNEAGWLCGAGVVEISALERQSRVLNLSEGHPHTYESGLES
ncbi:hypothetical protein L1887_48037 [Cichorium endivia]|nr:hypothetical protein L1887_48037 [Cichorium endivia]